MESKTQVSRYLCIDNSYTYICVVQGYSVIYTKVDVFKVSEKLSHGSSREKRGRKSIQLMTERYVLMTSEGMFHTTWQLG